MPDPAVTLDRVALSLDGNAGRVDILHDISVDVARGETLGLVGPSGSGKSSLLMIMGGLERATSGRVAVLGTDITDLDEDTLARFRRDHMGVVFQSFHLIPTMTALENVATPLELAGAADAFDRAEAELRAVGLGRRLEHYPAQLSGGEQQRVALARALAPRPGILLMDEPFSGLDNRLRDEIRDATLSILKAEGTAVLMVTHEPEEAMRMADQILLMRNGRIVQRGAPYNIYNNPVDRAAAAFFSDINLIDARVRSMQVDTPFGLFLTPGLADGTRVEIVIRPQHLRIDFDRDGRGPNPTVEEGTPARGRVERARFLGGESLVEFRMEHDGSMLKATVPGVFLPAQGKPMWLSLRRDRCFVFHEGPEDTVRVRSAS